MFRRLIIVNACLLIALHCTAQLADNEFRNSDNPLYWQNHKPYKDYWQQDVQYVITASIDEINNIINGGETLTYWNNSPDTLTYVYFHLFQNAFVKGSHLHDLERLNKVKPRLGKYEAKGLGITLDNLTVDNGDVNVELDNTIMKVYLPKPLYPGKKVVFSMNFTTYFDNGSTRRRMQMYDAWGFKHYNGTQWFPKICVYDRKFGWDTYQHLNKEFYGDFGSYEVVLNFPSNYIVEATGELVNKKQMLPDTLLKKLDIKNFADKPWGEAPSTIIPYNHRERKEWHFFANNVHDFAFTADPSYRIGRAYWNGIECEALVQEPHAAGWQNGAWLVAQIIKTFSQHIGMYQYPKMVAADARDGMEYPMLTLDGGSDPGYRSLLVHEIGHNWFYGMVGSNETYSAPMDEGFTQFLTSYGLRKIDGDTEVLGTPRSAYRRYFSEPVNVMDRNVLTPYTYDELNQNELPLNTASDDFHNALNHGGGYREVYFKTASMLYNLEYVLGDSLFIHAMQHYFSQWQFAHPYFEDFRNSIIQYTHVDLNWFFDEWFTTTKTLDYGITGIRRVHGTDSFSIHLRRTGAMQMPVDFTVTAKDGKKYSYYVPNTWFHKQTAATTLPKWYGWGKFYPRYKAQVQIPSGIKSVQIDTTYRLADRDWVDNYKSRGLPVSPLAIKATPDGGLAPITDRRHYRLYIRPDLWYNPIDGVKLGLHFEGDYLYTLARIDASIWSNTHVLQRTKYQTDTGEPEYAKYQPINYTFNLISPISRNWPKLQVQINSRYLDGLSYQRGGFNWLANDNNTVQLYAQTMWRPNKSDFDYLIYKNEWSSVAGHPNPSLNANWTKQYGYYSGSGHITTSIRTPLLANDLSSGFNYSYGQIEAINYTRIAKLELRTRVFGRYGTGNRLPYESLLFEAGANPEELMEDKYTRSTGFVPDDWQDISRYNVNHFQEGGGLGLRAYTGYFAPDERGGNLLISYKGRSGASANAELDVENYLQMQPRITRKWLHVNVYAFADGGVMELSTYSLPDFWNIHPTNTWSDFRFDAGLGTAFTIKYWGVFEKAKPLTIRFDVPIFMNRPPYSNPQYATPRYVIGVNRSF